VSRPIGNVAALVAEDDTVIVRIEIPKGSRNKYEYDEELDAIKLDRFLFSSMVYPTDYGYFPDTLGEDDDPLDAMVCVSEPTFPGCVIEANPIALFKMEDDHGIDDKILCVPIHDPAWNNLEKLEDLPEQLRNEIEHFFSVYKDLEQKKVNVDGWYSREDALSVIEESRKRHADQADSSGDDQEPDRDGAQEPDNTESG
jgi:inorganic pyrophosphatase